MIVDELIQELQNLDPNAEIRFEADTHDHWRTVIAKPIRWIDEVGIKHSDYHNADTIIDEEDEDVNADLVYVIKGGFQ